MFTEFQITHLNGTWYMSVQLVATSSSTSEPVWCLLFLWRGVLFTLCIFVIYDVIDLKKQIVCIQFCFKLEKAAAEMSRC